MRKLDVCDRFLSWANDCTGLLSLALLGAMLAGLASSQWFGWLTNCGPSIEREID